MNTHPIPRGVIIESFTWEGSATDIANFLNHFYKCRTVNGFAILTIWADELETNAVMRELGERPFLGFAQTPQARLAASLLAGRDITLVPSSLPEFAHGKSRAEQGGSSA